MTFDYNICQKSHKLNVALVSNIHEEEKTRGGEEEEKRRGEEERRRSGVKERRVGRGEDKRMRGG